MGFFTALFRVIVTLISLPLSLGGFFGFWYGIYMIVIEKNKDGGKVVACSILALTIGTVMANSLRQS